ncbi:MAG: AMP-binding protein, partial [Desulfobacteraceae bacterium]|nr:AMP-binding protein [Desulfobacteraceae bacterium]
MNYSGYAAIHAQNIPDKVCLIERTPSEGGRKTFTWKEFNDEINRLANYLSKEMGVEHGDYVMHLQNDSLNWLVTYFAIIRLGAVVVPLNFRFESSDILYAAKVCDPKVFIFGSEFLGVVQGAQKDLKTVKNYICVGEEIPDGMIDFKTIQAYDDISDALVSVDRDHNLAMMFTSG